MKLTPLEKKSLLRLKQAFAALPKSIRVYVVDDVAIACKRGVPSNEFSEIVSRGLCPCAYLTDAHDDLQNGKWD
jgi:hypothetical protein